MEALERELTAAVGGEVRFDKVSRALYSTDASVYQIHPLGVVIAKSRDDIVRTVALKQQLAEEHSALAVDQESLAVAQLARDHKTRFLAVRVISDDLSSDLPPEILSIVGATGSVRFGAAVGALWKRPSAAKDMWRLREQAQSAATRLATFLDGVVIQLHASTKSTVNAKSL